MPCGCKYINDDATDLGSAGFGLMYYGARMYDPYLNHFTQPDTIVPDPYNSQDYDRYAYARNNPVKYTDPSGHAAENVDDSSCKNYHTCRQDYLARRSQEVLESLGGNDDRKAMRDIIKVGESLFHEYDDLLPALTQIFNGINSADMVTIYRAFKVGPCSGVGRGENDCPTNQYSFGDSGFHEDFWDHGYNQIFHVWPYIANTGGTYSFGGAGLSIAQFANFIHETATSWQSKGTNIGASWNDYFLSQAGMEIGVAITNGEVAPDELADFVYWRLGPDGPGSYGMVNIYTQNFGPLYFP